MHIGNALGTLLDYDKSFTTTGVITMAYILVHLHMSEALEESIILRFNQFSRMQPLDYEGIPFQGCIFHSVGHLDTECPLLLKLEASIISYEPISEAIPSYLPSS